MRPFAWFMFAVIAAGAQMATAAEKFVLKSADIPPNAKIAVKHVYKGFGCEGGNVSPALEWSGAPAGTKSFAITMYDPDAPTGSGWWHWVVYNIPAATGSLPAGAGDAKKGLMPKGAVQGRTDYGSVGYGGPCPPPGKPHHYNFRLYALKVPKLEVPEGASAALIAFNVRAQALGEAQLTGMYGR